MSEEERVETTQQPAEEPQQVEEQQAETVDCGYIVAVKPDGQFVFNPIGTDITLVSLLGLHAYASTRVQELFDRSTGRGNTTLTKQLNDLVITLRLLLNQMTTEE